MAEQYNGFLGGLGLPTHSIEEERKARQRAAYREGTRGIAPNDTSMASMGARIGASMAAHTRGDIDPETAKKFELVQMANQRMQQFQQNNPEEWENMSVEDRGMFYHKTLASSAFELGLDDVGTTAATQFADLKHKREARDLELRKLGMDIRQTQRDNKYKAWERDIEMSQGTRGVIYPVGSVSPNSGRSAMLMRDGTARYTDKNGNEVILQPGQYTERPQYNRPVGGGSRAANSYMTPSNQDKVRVLAVSLMNQARVAMSMADLLEEAVQEDGTVDFLAEAGLMQKFVSATVNNVTALARSAGESISIPVIRRNVWGGEEKVGYYNPNAPGTAHQVVKDLGLEDELRANYESMVSNMGDNSMRYQNWEAMVVRLAYARAMAREPGARQLSDADFKNAVAEIGAGSTNPEAFRRTMLAGMEADYASFDDLMYAVPDPVRGDIFGTGFYERFNGVRDAFMKRFGTEFGTAGDPREGIGGATPPPQQQRPPEVLPDGTERHYTKDGVPYIINPAGN